MRGYDQWKTASPCEEFPDWIWEAEQYLKRNEPTNVDEAAPYEIINGLMEVLEDEGIYKRSKK